MKSDILTFERGTKYKTLVDFETFEGHNELYLTMMYGQSTTIDIILERQDVVKLKAFLNQYYPDL